MKLLQLQTKVFADKTETLNYIEKFIKNTITPEVDFIALPEMFSCPYENKFFPLYAETYRDTTYKFCQNIAEKYHVYLSAGSIPVINAHGNIFNMAYVFDDNGNEIAHYAKMHLFDIDIANGQYFKESDTLTAGDEIAVFDTKWGKMGICICYDFRFPELSRLMVDKGAKVIFVPAAFNMTTGPLHWNLMFQSRAVDNQVFTIGTAPAYNKEASYHSWGHSIVVSPWGKILNELDLTENHQITDINLNEVNAVREQLPLLKHRRLDIYNLKEIK